MLKSLLRILASILLLVAVIAATNDVTRSLQAGETVRPLSAYEHWSHLAPVTLEAARKSVERHTHPLVWSLGLVKMLQLPAWALLGALAALLAWLGRRRRTINVFAN